MVDLISVFNIDNWNYSSSPLLILLLGGAVITAYNYLSSQNSKNVSSSFKAKQPNNCLPPIGPTFAEFFPNMVKAENQADTISKYGNVFTVPSPLPGIIPTQVVINEPEIVKELCIRQANMYRDPSNFTTRGDVFALATRRVVGTGVTGLKGDEWHWRKMALLKEFHRNKLLSNERGLLASIIHEGKELCNILGDAADSGEIITADHITTKAAVGVVLFFLFGRRLEFDTDHMRKAAKDMIDSLFEQLTNPFYGFTKYIPNTAANKTEKKLKKSQRIIDSVVATELDLLLEEYYGTKPIHPDRTEGSVMSSLIANESRFRKGGTKAMLAEARVFVQAGFETTAHSLAFAMGMMAERPDLADEMRKQGMDSFGIGDSSSDSSLFYNVEKMKMALDNTPMVTNFFHESFRLYPLAPSLGGECTNDIDIITKGGTKYTLPKGTATFFLNLPLQRQVQPNPDEIIPNRWDVSSVKDKPFLHTFQNGPHSCPGKPLSLLEGRVFLLLIALQYEFEFPPGATVKKVQYEDGGLLRPKDGMPLLVKRRA